MQEACAINANASIEMTLPRAIQTICLKTLMSPLKITTKRNESYIRAADHTDEVTIAFAMFWFYCLSVHAFVGQYHSYVNGMCSFVKEQDLQSRLIDAPQYEFDDETGLLPDAEPPVPVFLIVFNQTR